MTEVIAEVVVPQPPARAFDLFTREVNRWWRLGERYGGTNVRGHRFEPFLGGRFLEILDQHEGILGVITVWEPPTRLAFSWRQSNWDPTETTQVEVSFQPVATGTRVTLRHHGFEAIQSDVGCDVGYQHGWRELLGWLKEAAHSQPKQPGRKQMYVNISIMKANDGYEQETIDSMHRFGEAAKTQPGLKLVTTLRDDASGDLFGLAIWETAEAARAASPTLIAAVERDDFDTWVNEMQNFSLNEV